MKTTVVFFSGLPKAGKSVTLAEIYHRKAARGDRFFLLRACPDCEGVWTADSGRSDLARSEKGALKAAGKFFSSSFVEFTCASISGLTRTFPLVLVDMGGIPSAENRRFVDTALAAGAEVRAILLRPHGSDAVAWRMFWADTGVPVSEHETRFAGCGDFRAEAARTATEVEAQL